ncbi:AAA family ATPase [Marinomonas sp. M1K-6]|uniref:AAA family ATPase n=1 Tax=Marinomonas profundi TaxID=2726122 RepID=A0A847R3L7_9GAMM|nr:AAA family ATPase [Marinomonas profundi]NLQ18541.1 AAA family ATPase [Marinomonas profundi]UDV04413.1 AAA family ATPase [Marinomonas profundi]
MSKPDFQFDLEDALNQPPKATLRDPFGSKDASVYFASEEGNQQLALLEHLSRYSSLLSVVQGPQGSGKSRFLMEFARHQDDTTVVSHVKATMLMTAGQLLQAMYLGFASHFSQPPNETTFGPLLKFSHDLDEKGQAALVLIDNAQELNSDAVGMLLDMMSLATENQTVPHVVLFSEYSLARNLDAFQRSRYEQLSHSFTLAPYSLEQTRAYLLHRVRAVGGEINLPFNDKQVKQIHQESGGYPGRINQLAQAMMGNGNKPAKSALRFNLAMGFPLAHMALLSVVMLGILVAVLFSDTPSTSNTTAKSNNVIPLTPRQGQSSTETIARIDAMQRRIGEEGEILLPPIPVGTSLPPISTSNGVSSSPSMLSPAIATAPLRNEAPTVAPAPEAEGKVEPIRKEAPSNLKETDPFDKTQWWLSQNPNRYTLQLLGTHNQDTVKDFIRDQGSISAFGYFKSKHNGRDWFVVVYGSYRNRSEAIAAAESLPKDIRDLNPWARSARGIQDDIKKAQ